MTVGINLDFFGYKILVEYGVYFFIRLKMVAIKDKTNVYDSFQRILKAFNFLVF